MKKTFSKKWRAKRRQEKRMRFYLWLDNNLIMIIIWLVILCGSILTGEKVN